MTFLKKQELHLSGYFSFLRVWFHHQRNIKCPKISYSKVVDRTAYANSADPDQTATRSSRIKVYTVCHSTKYFKKQLHKKQNLGPKSMV